MAEFLQSLERKCVVAADVRIDLVVSALFSEELFQEIYRNANSHNYSLRKHPFLLALRKRMFLQAIRTTTKFRETKKFNNSKVNIKRRRK